ncbi:hypothetical protein LSM04_005348 [Trypanosoma melophagium]|uniref:uncharacterized protein n=1 Tax=Trypanosoma melophagium TaxID=715481 RepID=UPI00351A93C4|nr:hypothetical protein LSM04_005348 [Trypanosoma melophagium]
MCTVHTHTQEAEALCEDGVTVEATEERIKMLQELLMREKKRLRDDDDDCKVTPKITENASLSYRSRESLSQSSEAEQCPTSRTPPAEGTTTTRGRSVRGRGSWTLAGYYAGWQ